jgi:uncharacterized membrane protein
MHANWPAWLRSLLYIHIFFGASAFLCAPIALATRKGGRNHRTWGKIYFWSMFGVAASALVLSFALPVWFLAMVSVFSFYAAYSAYRILYLKALPKGARPAGYDWVAAVVTFIASALLCIMGFIQPRLMGVGVVSVAGFQVSIVSIVFGMIGMRLGYGSLHQFLRPPQEKLFWWFEHMKGMIGSYIAAMTAFSAVNLSRWFGAAWWVWLWPTIVGVPAIAFWSAYYKRKFAARRSPAAV